MPALVFGFASGQTANRLVAGVPAAARLARAFALALPGEALVLAVGEGGALSAATRAEIARLAPGLAVQLTPPSRGAIPGETLPDPATIAALSAAAVPAPPPPADPAAALGRAARAIIRSTAKPGDGIVSRHINRPVSQTVSAWLLRLGWVRPGHATALTALIALAMFACLLSGTPAGLIWGAVLFQLASVADGIDGEIARAAHRTSLRGASLDSMIDGLTNCGFLLGAGINYLLQGQPGTAGVALAAAAIMATGLTLLGRHALRHDGYVHFDGLKHANPAPGKTTARWLKDLTSRDFYCLFLLVMALAGWLAAALQIFLIAVAIWLMATCRMLLAAR